MSFRTFQFLPAEPKGAKGDKGAKGTKSDSAKDAGEEKKIQWVQGNACFIIGGDCRFTLNSTFYQLVEIVKFSVEKKMKKITRTEFYSRIENAANGSSWKSAKPGLNREHIKEIFKKNKPFLQSQKLWANKDVDRRATLKILWHACIQYRKRWNALKLRDLTRKDRFIDSWENFLIYVYAPYFWKHPEFLKKSNFYDHMRTDDSTWEHVSRDDLQAMKTMIEGSQQKMEEISQGNEVTRYIIRQFDRRLPEWQIDPGLKPYMLDFIYMNQKILQPCIDDFMAKDAKNPIESREGDLLTQQMKHLVDELDSTNVEYRPDDNLVKMQLLGYGIEDSNRCISNGMLKKLTCFVTGKSSKGVGDHLYPILNAWKVTGKCGSNSLWNLLPVISSINKGYTRVMIADTDEITDEVDLEVTEITHVYTNDAPDENVPIDEFMTGITRKTYNEKKDQIKYVDMSQTVLSEEEEWEERGQICILMPPRRKIIHHVRVRILSTVELQGKIIQGKITSERISNYVLSEPLDIWMKIYLWRKYAEKRGANLSYEISQEVHKKLLGVLRNSFMTIAEETQKIIDLRVFAGQTAKRGE